MKQYRVTLACLFALTALGSSSSLAADDGTDATWRSAGNDSRIL
jgi:hypothetical protein